MIAILTNNESTSDVKSENSNSDESVNYMAFNFVVTSELVEGNENFDDIE